MKIVPRTRLRAERRVSGGLGLDSVALGIQEEYKRELEESEEGRTDDSDGTRSAGGNGQARSGVRGASRRNPIHVSSPAAALHLVLRVIMPMRTTTYAQRRQSRRLFRLVTMTAMLVALASALAVQLGPSLHPFLYILIAAALTNLTLFVIPGEITPGTWSRIGAARPLVGNDSSDRA